jgi:glutamine amidotransferase-like uncharacterized protein
MTATIAIYVDEGASVATVIRSLARELEPRSYIVRAVLAEDLDDDQLFHGLAVFVMPGGAELPYACKLKGSRNARLRRWVEAGGVYLGLCAGAYYACTKIAFHVGREDEVSGFRELGFLDGVAVGSLPELAPPYDFTFRSAAVAPLILDGRKTAAAYYQGGPRFVNEPDAPVEVLARYATIKGQPPAIVQVGVGGGKGLLSGVHPEISAGDLALEIRTLDDPAMYRPLLVALESGEAERRRLWRMLLERCGLVLHP